MAGANRTTRPSKARSLNLSRRLRRLAVTVVPLAIVLASCAGDGPQTSLEPKGEFARGIDGLWILVFGIATAVFVVVMVALLFAIFRFREREGDDRQPKQIHGNNVLEISWTILPAVILAVLAVPTVQGVFELRDEPDPNDRIDVYVTGHQWWWELEYVDYTDADGRALLTANELHIPAGQEVYLSMTSADVIHSFWVPPLNGKRDVVPGKLTNLRIKADDPTPPGEPILGQCAEFCGLAHADMRIRVFVHEPSDFDAWVAEQLAPAASPVASDAAAVVGPASSLVGGWNTFTALCTACHQANVEYTDGVTEVVGVPDNRLDVRGLSFHSALAPDLTHFGSRTTFAGASFVNITEHLAEWLAEPVALKPMQPELNNIAEGRILGMPNLNLDSEQIQGLIALLQSWE